MKRLRIRRRGITRQALAGDPVLLAVLGDDLARDYLAVKRAESAQLSGLALADEVARLVEAC